MRKRIVNASLAPSHRPELGEVMRGIRRRAVITNPRRKETGNA